MMGRMVGVSEVPDSNHGIRVLAPALGANDGCWIGSLGEIHAGRGSAYSSDLPRMSLRRLPEAKTEGRLNRWRPVN